MDINTYLQEIGLSERESAVYLACLSLGDSQIVPIAKKAAVPRTTAFQILEKFERMKLIDIGNTTTRRVYSAREPRTVLNILKEREQKAGQIATSFEASLPELNQLYNLSPYEPKIRFFRGRDEIRQMYEEILDAPITQYSYIAENDTIIEVIGLAWLNQWLQKRIARGIWSKAIRVKSKENTGEPLYAPGKENLRELRYPPEGFRAPAHIIIYGESVQIITSTKESIGVVITSADYATTMQSWFEEIWKISTPAQQLSPPGPTSPLPDASV